MTSERIEVLGIKIGYHEPSPCEYGYPDKCGKQGIFRIPSSKYFPVDMFTCEEHLFEMAINGTIPVVCCDYVEEEG